MDSADDVDDVFRSVPKDALPDLPVVLLEVDGELRWLVREGEASPELIEELNRLATHLIRHGLWIPNQQRESEQGGRVPQMRHAG